MAWLIGTNNNNNDIECAACTSWQRTSRMIFVFSTAPYSCQSVLVHSESEMDGGASILK